MKEKSARLSSRALISTLDLAMKEIEEESRTEAGRYLAQLEDALANLCHMSNLAAKTAIRLIMERVNHIPPYTPRVMTGEAARRYKEDLAAMTPEERRELEVSGEWRDEAVSRGYGEAIVAIREFYGSLTQLLTQTSHGPDVYSYVGVGAWRILKSYHPNLRFHQVKTKRKHGRVRRATC